MEIDCKLMKTGKAISFKYPDPIYVLYNPWCKGILYIFLYFLIENKIMYFL